jgi:hypothetical protein
VMTLLAAAHAVDANNVTSEIGGRIVRFSGAVHFRRKSLAVVYA